MMSNELNVESFDSFLNWLDSDRETAARKYEELRVHLISFLNRRRCLESEKLADDALNIFIRSLPRLREKISDPLPYLTAVARNLFIHHLRDMTTRHAPLPENLCALGGDEDADDEEEEVFRSLDECLRELDAEDRKLFLDYYVQEKQEKIYFRRELAGALGISPNALRLRIYHLKARLRLCINGRLARPLRK